MFAFACKEVEDHLRNGCVKTLIAEERLGEKRNVEDDRDRTDGSDQRNPAEREGSLRRARGRTERESAGFSSNAHRCLVMLM